MAKITRRIVCLANSRRPHGSCIAGKEILEDGQPGMWIRPVSPNGKGGVSDWHQRCTDGGSPKVLDIVDVPLLDPSPKNHQQENWQLDSSRKWKRETRLDTSDLMLLVDNEASLWASDHKSSLGRNNVVPVHIAKSLTDSLRLIYVDELQLYVSTPYEKRVVRGGFRYAKTDYWLHVTDPVYEDLYSPKRDGNYKIGPAFLTISLAEPHVDDNCYKLIAAIITP